VGITGRGASRKVLTADAFFRRLEARKPALLVAASGDLGTTAASCEGGSSTTGASVIGAVTANFFGSSLSLEKKQKKRSKVLCPIRQKEEHMKKSAKNSRVQGIKKLFFFLLNRGLPGHILERKELRHTFPLLIKTKVFGKCRRRRRSRTGPFQRIFVFISVLAVLSLGGFRGSGNRHILNGSSLWKRTARNKRLVILEGKQADSYEKNIDKIKEDE
jgi:hypothetical protein